MASLDDLNSTQKGGVVNLSTIAQSQKLLAAPGQTLSSTISPKGTAYTTLSTTSVQVIGSSVFRRGLAFFNSNQTAVLIWVVPSNVTATANVGIPLSIGSSFWIQNNQACNAAWNAIASTGSANVLTIIEFF